MKMKTVVLATLLFASAAFADTAYMKIGDIKGEAKDTESLVVEGDLMNGVVEKEAVEGDLLNTRVIDNEENAAEEVKDAQRTKGDTTLGDVVVTRELDKSSTKAPANGGNLIDQHRQRATDHNSSRSNKTSSSRKLDTDDDNDGVPTTEACNAVDNDCDDARADNDNTKSGSINTIKSSCTLEEKLKGNKICPKD